MQAVTNFDATRGLIEYAVSVFRSKFKALQDQEVSDRQEWIAKKVGEDWFKRPEKYWTAYANGEAGDLCDRIRMNRAFQPKYYNWYSEKLKCAEELLKKFDCAVGPCQAKEITLSDEDLALISISLQSALEN
jgi:hypothetical protein